MWAMSSLNLHKFSSPRRPGKAHFLKQKPIFCVSSYIKLRLTLEERLSEALMISVGCSNCGHIIELDGSPPSELFCPRCKKKITIPAEQTENAARPVRTVKHADGAGKIPAPIALSAESAGQMFRNYEIIGEISRGAMGIVYKARQVNLNRIVALKVLIATDQAREEQIERFYRETQSVARLRHPNIIPIYDMGVEKGVYYFSMEFVEGESLESKIERGKIAPAHAIEIIEQVASAIHHAHERGIIHRDIKPANILIDQTGRVQVTDFGLAKELGKSGTRTGITVGTPHYMSAEQARGESSEVDERSDVYSLGAVFYEMLTGRPVFDGQTDLDIVLKVLNEEPVAPRKLNPRIPRDLEQVCLKALQKEKWQRYQSAAEFLCDIRRCRAGEPVTARPGSPLHRAYRSVRKRKQLVSVILAGFAALAVVYFISDYRARRALQRENESAQREKETAEREKELQNILQSRQKQQEKWKTVFASRFTEESLSQWSADSDIWKAIDGALQSASEKETAITFAEPIPGNIRVSFDLILDRPLTGYFGLLLCSFRKDLYSGYRLLFFAERLALQKEDTTKKIVNFALQTDTSYKIVAVRENDIISIKVGENELVNYQDLTPLTGEEAALFRFILSGCEVRIANLVIEKESIPLQTSPLFVADKLFNDGLYSHAAEIYRRVAQTPPDEDTAAEALYKLSLSLVKLDSRSEALSHFSQLIARFPQSKYNNAAKLQVGLCYLNLKEYDQFRSAVKDYNLDLSLGDILREAPLSVVKDYLAFVESQQKAHTPQEKIAKLREFILVQTSLPEEGRDHEKLAEAYLSLAAALTSQNQYEEAAKIYRELLTLYPGKVKYAFEAQFELARTYCLLNDFASAATVLQELIEKCTPEAFADALLGRKASASGGLEEIPDTTADAQTWQTVISYALKCNLAQQSLTYILLELDRPDEALSFLTSVEKEHSERAQAATMPQNAGTRLLQELAPYSTTQTAWSRFWLGNIYIMLGNPQKALEPLLAAQLPPEKGAQIAPETALTAQKDSSGSPAQPAPFVASYTPPQNSTVELALFVCYLKLGKTNEAKQHLKTALSLSPWFFGTSTQTVLHLLTLDSLPEDIPESTQSNTSAYQYLIAQALLTENKTEKATLFLQRAVSNRNPWPYYPANAQLTALKRSTPGF